MIEELLERYFEGETSAAEEKQIRAFFASGEVPEHPHNSSRKSSSRLFCDLTVHFFSGRNARFYARQLFAEGLKLLANGRTLILRVLPARRRAAGDIVRGAFRPRLFF